MRCGPHKRPRIGRNDDYFNLNLRNARVEAGYTQKELAEKVGVSAASVRFYECLWEFPSPATAERIANALSAKVDYLFPENFREIAREVRMEKKDSLRADSQLSSFDDVDRGKLVTGEIPERELSRREMVESVDSVLRGLNYREREILKLKYGIGGGYCYGHEEIGRMFKVTRERVRQIEKKAMAKLKHIPIAPRLEIFWEAS